MGRVSQHTASLLGSTLAAVYGQQVMKCEYQARLRIMSVNKCDPSTPHIFLGDLESATTLSKSILILKLAAQPKGSKCGTRAKVTFSSLEGNLKGFLLATSRKRCSRPQLSRSLLLHKLGNFRLFFVFFSPKCALNFDSLVCWHETTAHSEIRGPSR